MSSQQSTCTYCDDETVTMTKTCYNCKTEWLGQKPYILRTISCPVDHVKPTMCGMPSPSLCDDCISKGFYLDSDSCMSFFRNYTVKQKLNK